MIWLSIIGLSMDLVGVLILGADVLTLQNEQRQAAQTNKKLLEQAFEGGGSLEYIRTRVESGDVSEGLFEGNGSVDVSELERALEELKRESGLVGNGLVNTLDYLTQSVGQQFEAASRSLRLTAIGLVLIVCGFFLQVAGTILSNQTQFGGL